jgi:hypothetical protein
MDCPVCRHPMYMNRGKDKQYICVANCGTFEKKEPVTKSEVNMETLTTINLIMFCSMEAKRLQYHLVAAQLETVAGQMQSQWKSKTP